MNDEYVMILQSQPISKYQPRMHMETWRNNVQKMNAPGETEGTMYIN